MARPLPFKTRVRLAPAAFEPSLAQRRSLLRAWPACLAYAGLLYASWALGTERVPVARWLDDLLREAPEAAAVAARHPRWSAPAVAPAVAPPVVRPAEATPSFAQVPARALSQLSLDDDYEVEAPLVPDLTPKSDLSPASPSEPAPSPEPAAPPAEVPAPTPVAPSVPTAPPSGRAVAASDGLSCEAARDQYAEEIVIGGAGRTPDLPRSAFDGVLSNGRYLSSCGVSVNTDVRICAAIQRGRAVGVTVTTRPGDTALSRCIARAVRGLSFPSSPHLDVTHTHFAAR